ncbi:PVC-type heme-binding CxxCH protein [Maribacter arcticus]|uniref:Putative membrane-bound dehydrogenase domain-containing protein n=1 Tax=Maribacter arcticus TaxID=561365 RepID=A0A1T5CNP2_9FLAO|nr:PVC-type heme-binding CxxCH protein [Maribacter arcticus]SKB61128.1 putative membrane-bound dehydrogenase domain-containing protein [Maribacter arcticus]
MQLLKSFKVIFTVGVLLGIGIQISCSEKATRTIDYTMLSEKEKRKPENALSSMEVADGLKLSLFASEPILANPTNMAIDSKGRIWICEGTNYRDFSNPDISYDNEGDRILILEDTDHDGVADTSKVFYQGKDVNSALGIAVLGSKIIISVSPNVLVFTDENGDDVPDSKEILFSGIEGVDHDHGVHAFVFGPDSRLYFNYGNNGKQLLDKDGNAIKDIHGNNIIADGSNYREGMAFRMEMDGSNIEVLGHNFRNPYELAVDSYGGLWQSDNDDDGNRGTRINYLMEYGNYGYKDVLTGKNWRERRTGWEDEIPKRHWHLNDPGTVPNLLQTGSGSPCGITVYEDELLPEKYQGQLIHAEPGHNVVRSYMVEEKGSGYTAIVENLIKSKDDWFRPDDVTVAPDGSLFISDWYDGGVGGHKAEDIRQGRIYRLSTKEGYTPKTFDFNSGAGAAEGLLSGNMDVFYQSWQKLNAMGDAAEPYLKEMIAKGGTGKARALWLGAKNPSKTKTYIEMALTDTNAKFRLQGIRMARYLAKNELERYLEIVATDSSPQVRREAAIALRYLGTKKAAELWATLAEQHDPADRWSLEALGIGSDKFPNLYFSAWKENTGNDWMDEKGKQIVWRTRASATIPLLAEMIKDDAISEEDMASYFRAFDFKDHPKKDEILLALLSEEHPKIKSIQAYVVGQLNEDFVNNSRKHTLTVKNVLPKIEGTAEWLMAVKKLGLKNQTNNIFELVRKGNDEALRKEAVVVLFDFDGDQLVEDYLKSDAPEAEKMEVLGIMSGVSGQKAIALLKGILMEDTLNYPLTRRVVEVLGNSGGGQKELYELLEAGKLPDAHKTTAVLKLMNSWNSEIRENAPKFLEGSASEDLDVDALVERSGDAVHGKELYNTYCSSCHIAGPTGVEFGPALSDIGNKLSKQFLYSNIIYPSAGISFGYEGYTIKMRDGTTYNGYILSRAEDELVLKMMGGAQREIELADIVAQEAMEKSLMTEGLNKVMSEEDLVDLVEYLGTLKVEEDVVDLN